MIKKNISQYLFCSYHIFWSMKYVKRMTFCFFGLAYFFIDQTILKITFLSDEPRGNATLLNAAFLELGTTNQEFVLFSSMLCYHSFWRALCSWVFLSIQKCKLALRTSHKDGLRCRQLFSDVQSCLIEKSLMCSSHSHILPIHVDIPIISTIT